MRIRGIFLMAAAGVFLCLQAALAVDEPGKSLEITLETDGAAFAGISKKVLGKTSSEVHRQVLRKGFYYIEALDAAGKVLYVRTMPPADEVFYDYSEPADTVRTSSGAALSPASPQGADQPLKGGKLKLAKAQLMINLPNDPDIKTLKINIIKDPSSPSGKSGRRISGSRKPASALAPAARDLKATLDLSAIPEEK